MPRLAWVVFVDVAHHVTQRGSGRQFILRSDVERLVYLDMLSRAVRVPELAVVGYCLMSNHVHPVVVPRRAAVLAETFKQVHGRYASYWNLAHACSRYVWQGRFFSCPMDLAHLWTALRYAELNPEEKGVRERREKAGKKVTGTFLWAGCWDGDRHRHNNGLHRFHLRLDDAHSGIRPTLINSNYFQFIAKLRTYWFYRVH